MRPCHFFPHCECVLGIGHPVDSVVNTKLPAILSHRHRTTVSLETYTLYSFKIQVCWHSPFPIPHFLFSISYSPFPILHFLFSISYSPFPIPHFLFPISYSPFPIPHFLFPISYSPFPIPHSPFLMPHSSFLIPHSSFPVPSSIANLKLQLNNNILIDNILAINWVLSYKVLSYDLL